MTQVIGHSKLQHLVRRRLLDEIGHIGGGGGTPPLLTSVVRFMNLGFEPPCDPGPEAVERVQQITEEAPAEHGEKRLKVIC